MSVLYKACSWNATDVLFPLPEPGLLGLDLLSEAFAESFLLFFKFGIIGFLYSRFAELPGLHLLLTVILVVDVFGCGDQVKHVRANQAGSQLSKIAVVLIFNWEKVSPRLYF